MAFLISWIWGSSEVYEEVLPEPKGRTYGFDIPGSQVLVEEVDAEKKKTVEVALSRVRVLGRERSRSFGSLRELQELERPKIRRPRIGLYRTGLRPLVLAGADNPYEHSFHSTEQRSNELWQQTSYFTDARALGVRGQMKGTFRLRLATEEEVVCAKQVLIDGHRWGASPLVLAGKKQPLQGERHLVPADDKGQVMVPEFLIQAMTRVYQIVDQNPKLLYRFSRLFNQGPFNDILGNIQCHGLREFGCLLIPDADTLKRSIHLLLPEEGSRETTRLMLIIQGVFRQAVPADDWQVREAEADSYFGRFNGLAIVNLSGMTATVRMGIEMKEDYKTLIGLPC